MKTINSLKVTLFTEQYHDHLKRGLLSYSEAQIAHSRRTLESLTQIRDVLMNRPVNE